MMPLSSAAFQAPHSDIPPVVVALIQNIEARKTPLKNRLNSKSWLLLALTYPK